MKFANKREVIAWLRTSKQNIKYAEQEVEGNKTETAKGWIESAIADAELALRLIRQEENEQARNSTPKETL